MALSSHALDALKDRYISEPLDWEKRLEAVARYAVAHAAELGIAPAGPCVHCAACAAPLNVSAWREADGRLYHYECRPVRS